MNKSNAELLQEYFAAWQRDEGEAAMAMYDDDVVMYLPGRNRYSGTYNGKQAIIDYIAEAERITDGRLHVEEVIDILGSQDNAVARYVERGVFGDDVFDLRRMNIYGFRDGKITSIRVYEDDQYAYDEFIAQH